MVRDIFDNFDEYTINEKLQIQNELANLEKLNSILEKYENNTQFNLLFEKIKECWRNVFEKKESFCCY